MTKSKLWHVGAIGITVAVVALLGSCQAGVSITARINTFSNQYLSSQWNQLYTNFSTSTSDYATMQSGQAFWVNTPFYSSEKPTAIANINDSNPSAVTGTFTSGGNPCTVTMQMVQQGPDWYILSLTVSGSSSSTVTIKSLR